MVLPYHYLYTLDQPYDVQLASHAAVAPREWLRLHLIRYGSSLVLQAELRRLRLRSYDAINI